MTDHDGKARRTEAEPERPGFGRSAMDAVLFGWWVILPAALLLAGLIVGIYVVKSWLGIDLFDDHFVMHRLFFE